MDEVTNNNWVGKLQELGMKCRFVPIIDVAQSSNYNINVPSFKCVIDIKELAIHVESTASNKKTAKTTAAKTAYEKICDKTNAPQSSSVDKIAVLLKDLDVKDDEMTVAANFFKKITELKLDSSDINYTELKKKLLSLNCTLTYKHDEYNQENEPEFRFRCDVRPEGYDFPAISGFGWSSSSKEEAKDKAVKQLISALNVYSKHA